MEVVVCVVWDDGCCCWWWSWEGRQSGSSPPQVPAVLPLLDEKGEELESWAWLRWLVGEEGRSGSGSFNV